MLTKKNNLRSEIKLIMNIMSIFPKLSNIVASINIANAKVTPHTMRFPSNLESVGYRNEVRKLRAHKCETRIRFLHLIHYSTLIIGKVIYVYIIYYYIYIGKIKHFNFQRMAHKNTNSKE
ncbi:hypothetical protein BG74_05550 [Sodalis-like endosymbiont of Proechinophthirus fluctus]|nr:hypothetical protein BG74_05550 [Sodalis-like endosymbiont of Proechinophthirus fluctus]